jgi:hypothetical protein
MTMAVFPLSLRVTFAFAGLAVVLQAVWCIVVIAHRPEGGVLRPIFLAPGTELFQPHFRIEAGLAAGEALFQQTLPHQWGVFTVHGSLLDCWCNSARSSSS